MKNSVTSKSCYLRLCGTSCLISTVNDSVKFSTSVNLIHKTESIHIFAALNAELASKPLSI